MQSDKVIMEIIAFLPSYLSARCRNKSCVEYFASVGSKAVQNGSLVFGFLLLDYKHLEVVILEQITKYLYFLRSPAARASLPFDHQSSGLRDIDT